MLKKNSIEEYHGGEGVSSSDLKQILRSPAHYIESKKTTLSTPALEFGTLVHTAILEPDELYKNYVKGIDVGDKRKKENKEAWESFVSANADKTIVSVGDWEAMESMKANVISHKFAYRILASCDKEISCYTASLGTLCKARADLLDVKNGFIWDLKTTDNAQDFAKSITKYKYHLSAAYYLDVFTEGIPGKTFNNFGWVVVEKKAPYNVMVLVADDKMLQRGREEYQEALDIYIKCMSTNTWPGYPEKIETISLPSWY